jgi:hypothetical protein
MLTGSRRQQLVHCHQVLVAKQQDHAVHCWLQEASVWLAASQDHGRKDGPLIDTTLLDRRNPVSACPAVPASPSPSAHTAAADSVECVCSRDCLQAGHSLPTTHTPKHSTARACASHQQAPDLFWMGRACARPSKQGVQTPNQHPVQPQGQRKETRVRAIRATYRCTLPFQSMRSPVVAVVGATRAGQECKRMPACTGHVCIK